MKIQWY